MPENPEYWTLNPRKVRELREQVLIQGQFAWDVLKPHGFTDWHIADGWIGCWIERKRATCTDMFGIQLYHESPLCFHVALKSVPEHPKASQSISLVSRTYDTIASLRTHLPELMKEVLPHIVQ